MNGDLLALGPSTLFFESWGFSFASNSSGERSNLLGI